MSIVVNIGSEEEELFNAQEFYNTLAETAVDVGLRAVYALIVYIIGELPSSPP